jgi:hypothetical protein
MLAAPSMVTMVMLGSNDSSAHCPGQLSSLLLHPTAKNIAASITISLGGNMVEK